MTWFGPLSLLLYSQYTRMASLVFILCFTLTQFLTVSLFDIVLLNFIPTIVSIFHPSSLYGSLFYRLSPTRSFSVKFFQSFFSTSLKCFLFALLLVYRFPSICLSTTCQFLGGGGLFGDRWRSAFHLDGDPGGEARLGGREQLLIGQGIGPCHYAPSTAVLLDQCHSVSQGVARRHGPGWPNRLVVKTVRHFWGRAREDLDLSASSLSVALRSCRSCCNGCFSMACPLVVVNFVPYH